LSIARFSFSVESTVAQQPKEDDKWTQIVEGFSSCTVQPLAHGVDAIRLGKGAVSDASVLAAGTIYTRPFYPALLASIRKQRKVVLLSNPGTGKSMFQFYYLARLLNPTAFKDPLPTDFYGSSDIPKNIIRHTPGKSLRVINLEERKAYRVFSHDPDSVLQSFDPLTTLYWFEPAGSTGVGPFYEDITIPTLATVSPDRSRYHEFEKNGAARLYMPLFKEEELVTIGRDMLEQPDFPSDTALRELYTEESIRSRFKRFDGIIRHVLPLSVASLEVTRKSQNQAIANIDASKLLAGCDIENQVVSHFVAVYDMSPDSEEKYNFSKYGLKIVSEEVEELLKDKWYKTSLSDRMSFMRRYDEVSTTVYGPSAPKIYESIVADHLTSHHGASWERWDKSGGMASKEPFNLKLNRSIDGRVPTYAELDPGCLYRSLNEQFPFCDILYKEEGTGKLVCIQVSLENPPVREVSLGAFKRFCERLGLSHTSEEDCKKISFVYCPHAKLVNGERAKQASVRFEGGIQLASYTVWHISPDYSACFPTRRPAS
jgi:hypothetical protein